MANYLAPSAEQAQSIADSAAQMQFQSGVSGPKVLGDCEGLEGGLAEPFRDVDNNFKFYNTTKPLALHTEFAGGEANFGGTPYAPNSEIVFYLMRAGGGAGGGKQVSGFDDPYASQGRAVYQNNFSAGSPSNLPMQAGAQAPASAEFGSAVQTGPSSNMANIETQTPLNQVATKNTTDLLNQPVRTRASAGPMTGITLEQTAPIGSATQYGAEVQSAVDAAANLTEYKYSMKDRSESLPASQVLFAEVLQKSFNPSFDEATEDRIAGAIARGSLSSLAMRLAAAAYGVTTTRDLIEGINNGRLGLSSPAATAQARRLGPETLLETTTAPPQRPYSGATTYGATA
jgi:hypothetical protein